MGCDSSIGDVANWVTNPIGSATQWAGNQIGGNVGSAISQAGQWGSIMANPTGVMEGNLIGKMLNAPKKPDAPGTNPYLAQLQQQQLQYANQFQQNLPTMQKQMAQQLTNSSNKQMSAQVQQVKNVNNQRGLSYGGVNQGQQQAVRSTAQQNLAQGISSANANLENASNTLDAQAVQTGVGIQQTQQAIQNQIYQQQMAQMQAQNSMYGSVLGTGILAAAI